MAQYDGSIRINTKINKDGIKKGASDIKGSLKEIRSSASYAQNSLNKLSGAVKKLGVAIVATFAFGKIAKFGKEAIQAASDLEAVESQFAQVFGELSKHASVSLSAIADQAGIMEERMKSSYTKIAAFAKTTGMDTASSLELANRAMVAVADSAAFYDRSLEETTESLQSFLKGNYENDAALGLSATEFTRNAAANKLYGKTFNELSEAQKQFTLLQMVEDANKLSGALGQASREADTWTNQIGNLNQAWTNLKANLGKFILPMAVQAVKMITNVINAINEMLSRLYAAASAFRSFSELITGNKAQDGGASGYSTAAKSAESLAEANEDVADSTKKAAKAANGQLSALDKLNSITTKNEEASSDDLGTGTSELQFQEVDYGKLAEGETFADRLSESLSGIWDTFYSAWESKGQLVITSAKGAFESVLGLVKSIGTSIIEVFSGGVGTEWIESIFERFRSILDIIHSISGAFKSAWDSGAGSEAISAIFEALTNVNLLIASIGDSFVRAFDSGVGTEIFENVLGILTGIYDTIGGIAGQIEAAWNTAGLGDSIWNGILTIANTVLGTINNIAGATADWARNLDFTPLLESIDRLLKALQPLTENIGEGLEWFWNNVLLPIAGWVIQDAVPVFLDMISEALNVLNEIIEALKPLATWLWEEFLQPFGQWAGEKIISAMQTITDLLKKFGDWISEHQEVVQGFAITLGVLFSASMAAKILSAAASLGEYIINAGGLVAVLKSTTSSLVSNTAAWFSNIAAKIADKAETLAIIGLYAKDFIVNLAKGTAALIKQAAQFAINTAAKIADTAAQVAMTAATAAWNAVCTIATTLTTALGAAIAFLTSPIGIAIAAIGAIIAIGVLLYKNWEAVKKKLGELADWFSNKWKEISSAVGNAWNGITTAISNAISNVKSVISKGLNSIKSIWDRIWNALSSTVKNIFNGIWNTIRGVINGIIGGIEGMANGIISGINFMIRALNKIHFDIPDWVPGLGGKSFGFNITELQKVSIPRLATGTVVPPNKEFMAVLGDNKKEPEIVSPISTMKQAFKEALKEMGGAAGAGKIELHVVADVDGKTLFEITKEYAEDYFNRTGRAPYPI